MLVRGVLLALAVAAVALYGPSSAVSSVAADVALAGARLSHAQLMNGTNSTGTGTSPSTNPNDPCAYDKPTDPSCYGGLDYQVTFENFDCCEVAQTVNGRPELECSVSSYHRAERLQCVNSYDFTQVMHSDAINSANCLDLINWVRDVPQGNLKPYGVQWSSLNNGRCLLTLCAGNVTDYRTTIDVPSYSDPGLTCSGTNCR